MLPEFVKIKRKLFSDKDCVTGKMKQQQKQISMCAFLHLQILWAKPDKFGGNYNEKLKQLFLDLVKYEGK